MCGGSRWVWPLSDVTKQAAQSTTGSWPEKLLDPVESQDETDPTARAAPELVTSYWESKTIV
jgi:hypothetical protein